MSAASKPRCPGHGSVIIKIVFWDDQAAHVTLPSKLPYLGGSLSGCSSGKRDTVPGPHSPGPSREQAGEAVWGPLPSVGTLSAEAIQNTAALLGPLRASFPALLTIPGKSKEQSVSPEQ